MQFIFILQGLLLNHIVWGMDELEDIECGWNPNMWIDRAMKNIDPDAIFERAILKMPASYKIWHTYLDYIKEENPKRDISDLYERALLTLHKMPRIWMNYLSSIQSITILRRTLNRALKSLPITQHDRIWPIILGGIESFPLEAWRTASLLWSRYWQIAPRTSKLAKEYIECLKRFGLYDKAALLIVEIAKEGALTGENWWNLLIELLLAHAQDMHEEYDLTHLVGRDIPLTLGVATCQIRKGQFDAARDTFENAIEMCDNIKDFVMVFDSYAVFEEAQLTELVNLLPDDYERKEEEIEKGGKFKGAIENEMKSSSIKETQKRKELERNAQVKNDNDDYHHLIEELQLRLEKYKVLLEKRPFMINMIKIRKHPNNIVEWINRINLGRNNEERKRLCREALQTINRKKVQGLNEIYKLLVENSNDNTDNNHDESIKDIWEECIESCPNDTSQAWIDYSEWTRERNKGNLDDTINIASRGVSTGHANVELWNYYVDLEEARGLVEPTMAAYDQMIELKKCRIVNILAYGAFLREHEMNEKAYQIYEKGIALFGWPLSIDIWNVYIPLALADKQIRTEHLRDLFEQAIKGAPPEYSHNMYILYASLERNRGLGDSELKVLERGVKHVSSEHKADLFKLLIMRTREKRGLLACRSIYEAALSVIPMTDMISIDQIAVEYVNLETTLGDLERARAILRYWATISQSISTGAAWKEWEEWERKWGDEQGFREMLRIKRSIGEQIRTNISEAPKFVKSAGANAIKNEEEIQLE